MDLYHFSSAVKLTPCFFSIAMTSSSGTWLSCMSSKSSRLIGPLSVAMFLGGSASETKCGSTSYSTLMARTASSAVPSSTAATPTISSPAQKISVPGFCTISIAFTPGIFSAALVSMLLILA